MKIDDTTMDWEKLLEINLIYLEANSYRQNRFEIMADDQTARSFRRSQFKFKLDTIVKKPRKEEVDEKFIHYRWHYGDDSEEYDIETLRNGPRIRWLLYSTGIENPGMFFYSINEEDLAINPAAGTPRIGPFAPPVPAKGSVNLPEPVTKARKRTMNDFDQRLKDAVALAKQNNQHATGKIYCRWHFTDPKKPTIFYVINRDNTEAVRDVMTEFRVRYPNGFWVSCNAKDLDIKEINGIYRPDQGPLLPGGEVPLIWASTAGTGQTHDPPLPTGQPATKKAKPSATVSVPPPPTGTTTPRVIFLVPTDSGPEMAQVGSLDPFIGSVSPWAYSSPQDIDASLSSAAHPIPLAYLAATNPSEAYLIEPDSDMLTIHAHDTAHDQDEAEEQE